MTNSIVRHDEIVLLAKTNLNGIEVLIPNFIDSYINQGEFF